jgi:folate-binding protein YgfZ
VSATELVALHGPDAVSYLDSQCTQDLAALAVGASAETLVLDPSGTVVAVARATRRSPDDLVLEVPTGVGTALRTRLERFALRTEVAFDGPLASPEGAAAWFDGESARVRLGIPGPAELARGLAAHGLGAALRDRTLSFTKGCYPGQELVARMQSRGASAPWVLRVATLSERVEAPAPVGNPERAGEVTSVALDAEGGRWWALCVVHRRDAEHAELDVRGPTRAVARLEDDPSVRSGRVDAP